MKKRQKMRIRAEPEKQKTETKVFINTIKKL